VGTPSLEAKNIRLVNIITYIIEKSKLISENMSTNVTYYGRIVVKILYTPAPIKKIVLYLKMCVSASACKDVFYMYIVRTRFYTNFYI
jgi:hypothetical protein